MYALLLDYWAPLALASCAALESFTLALRVPSTRQACAARVPLAAACAALLAHLPRTTSAVVVRLRGVDRTAQLRDARALDLGLLDDELGDPGRHPGVAVVSVVLEGRVEEPSVEWEGVLSELLPKIHKAGMLRVELPGAGM